MDERGRPPDRDPDRPVFRSLRRRRHAQGPPWRLIGGLLLLAAVAAGAWYWLRVRDVEPVATTPPVAEPDTGEAVTAPEEPPEDLPELDASDAVVRGIVRGLTSHPRFAEWLVTDDLVRRFVTAVVNVAAGGSPAEQLDFMVPEGSFQAEESAEGMVIDPASYRRYDPAVDAFTSMETAEAARLYRRLHPLFVEAYAELGLRDRTFDETVAVAVGNLLAVEVPDDPIAIESDEGVYAFRDPSLERLTPARKHLLRLGPENARAVQARLRELAGALGITPRPAAPGGPGMGPTGPAVTGSPAAPRRPRPGVP